MGGCGLDYGDNLKLVGVATQQLLSLVMVLDS